MLLSSAGRRHRASSRHVHITEVRLIRLSASLPDRLRRQTLRSVRMQDLYGPIERLESHDRVTRQYLQLLTDEGHEATYGPITEPALASIRSGLASIVLGADPERHTLLWERMMRSERHLRSGHGMLGLSAIDNALWDLRGRIDGAPVHHLLGGSTRDRVPCYVSTLGLSHDHDQMKDAATELAETYPAQKWFFSAGPAQPTQALTDSVALAATLRATLGPDYPLMFDAVMAWDMPLAREWSRRVSDLRPTWLEEPFPAYDKASYNQLASEVDVPLAAGEHIYGRWEASEWLATGCLAYLQCDPEWCGGVSEFVRIAALASVTPTLLVPHGANIHAALHLAIALPPSITPRIEWLLELAEERAFFERDPVMPDDGAFELPTRPGFGIELEKAKADEIDVWTQTTE